MGAGAVTVVLNRRDGRAFFLSSPEGIQNMLTELIQIAWYTFAASGVAFWFYLGYVFYVAVTTSNEIGNATIIDPYDSLMDGCDHLEDQHEQQDSPINQKERQHA